MSAKPVYVFATWVVKAGKLEPVLALLKGVTAKSREEEGCLFYNVHQNIAHLNTIILYEAYTDEAALNEHRNTPHFKDVVVAQIVPLLESRNVVLANQV